MSFNLVRSCHIKLDEETKRTMFPSLVSLRLKLGTFNTESFECVTSITGKTLRELDFGDMNIKERSQQLKRNVTFLRGFESMKQLESLRWDWCQIPLIQFQKNISLEWRSNIKRLSLSFADNAIRSQASLRKQTELIYRVFPSCDLLVTKVINRFEGVSQFDAYAYEDDDDFGGEIHTDTDYDDDDEVKGGDDDDGDGIRRRGVGGRGKYDENNNDDNDDDDNEDNEDNEHSEDHDDMNNV